ncbi:hypothetical protein A5893_13860 [Pedobacter psychrophilus]|uniref:Uncharacterized protein n=1 Tax=Pedobacter psychrophilus TaxID=1826909 RepID=A0A179DBT4_9SPHI|nr:hypothetical protein [Pedobacter psychrophilus]OAQ38506.1 hypothetical protein A5893_13860 [Pedobacter psychrophilus]
MNKFPTGIQIEFFKLLNDELSIENFEHWVYETKELEFFFEQDDYLDFISLDFKDRHIIHEMKKIVDKYLNYGEYEKRKINRILADLISKNDDFSKSLIAAYDMYCDGYEFLDNIGMGYGLTFANEFFEFKDWMNLPIDEKSRRVNAIYKGIKTEAEKVQDWFDRKKIILTGEVDEIGHYGYIDNRTIEEKKPTGYSVINLDEKKSITYNSTLPKAGQTWLQKLFGN